MPPDEVGRGNPPFWCTGVNAKRRPGGRRRDADGQALPGRQLDACRRGDLLVERIETSQVAGHPFNLPLVTHQAKVIAAEDQLLAQEERIRLGVLPGTVHLAEKLDPPEWLTRGKTAASAGV